ncbi:hypothetical protein [Zhihengliuella halotolerans]|uniref:hypothetical protein n=1 Tax=Zhihengliuella halotolerans TaxID=370736 RepID=UPI0015E08321|nr:hypothetical protein [Zhihengliuella halotolerans]
MVIGREEDSVTLLVIVLMALAFGGGWLLGRKANHRGAAQDQHGLARAWQEGYDAAVAHLSPSLGPQSPPAPGEPGGPVITPAREAPPAVAQPTSAPEPAPPMLSVPPSPAAPISAPPSESAPAMTFPPPPAPKPALDPAARQLRNVNIALYVAAGLLIGAGLLFISFPIHPAAKLSVLGAVCALFYGGGLSIHARSRDLRSAATALTGIGLALIPVLGVAWHVLLEVEAATAWMIVSIVGSAAFVFASVRLRSQVVAVFALTFFVSLAWSGGAVLNRGLIWYFVFTMALAALFSAAAVVRPAFLGSLYVRTFVAAHRFLVPGVLVGALVMEWQLSRSELLLIGAAASVYYGVFAFTEGRAARVVNVSMFRLVASLTVLLAVHELTDSAEAVVWALLLILLAQLVLIAAFPRQHARVYPPRWWAAEVWVLSAVSAVTAVFTYHALYASFFGEGGRMLGPGILVGAAGIGAAGYLSRVRLMPILLALGAFALPLGVMDGTFEEAAWRVAGTSAFALLASEAVRRRVNEPESGHPAPALAAWRSVHLLLAPLVLGQLVVAVPGLSAVGAGPDHSGLSAQLVLMVTVAIAAWLGLALFTARGAAAFAAGDDDGARSRTLHVGGVAAAVVAALLLAGLGEDATWMQLPVERLSWWAVLLVALTCTAWIVRAGAGVRSAGNQAVAGTAWLLAVVVDTGRIHWPERDWALEILLGAGFAYSVALVLLARRPELRAVYAVVAQILMTWLALDLASRFDADAHARVAIAAATLAAGQGGRLLARRTNTGMGWRRTMGWAALVVLAVLPAGYALTAADPFAGGFGLADPTAGVDQASLFVQLLCLAAYAAVLSRRGLSGAAATWCRGVPGAVLAGILLAGSGVLGLRRGGWLPEPLWSQPAAALALAAGVLGSVAVAVVLERRRTAGASGSAAVAVPSVLAGVFAASGLVAAAGEHSAVAGAVLAASAYGTVRLALLWARPALAGVAVVVAAAAVYGLIADPMTESAVGTDALFGSGSPAPGLWALSFLAAGWIWWGLGMLASPATGVVADAAPWARRSGIVAVTLGVLAAQSGTTAFVVAACVLGAAAVVLAVYEWPPGRRRLAAHGATLAVTAYAVRVWHEFADPSLFWTLQAVTVVLVGLAVSEIVRPAASRHPSGLARRYLLASAAVLTCSAPVAVFVDGGWAQLWVLVGFVGYVLAGLTRGDRALLWWGAVGVAVALAWYLRDYSFVLLALLAIVLIVFALLSLRRLNRRPQSEEPSDVDTSV